MFSRKFPLNNKKGFAGLFVTADVITRNSQFVTTGNQIHEPVNVGQITFFYDKRNVFYFIFGNINNYF